MHFNTYSILPLLFSGIAWIEFLNNNDVLKDILFQLEEMNLACAQYLWLRHQVSRWGNTCARPLCLVMFITTVYSSSFIGRV